MAFLRRSNNRNGLFDGNNLKAKSFSGRQMVATSKPAVNCALESWEVDSILHKIQCGHYTHYAKGGFSRDRGLVMTATQVVQTAGVDAEKCLIGVNDKRIELAVQSAGLIYITPTTCRRIKRNEDSKALLQGGDYAFTF